MVTILFACVRNAGRSPMAEAFFNALADPGKARALSAGTDPAPAPHPEVVASMQEVGFDISAHVPRLLTEEIARGAQLLVTLGCAEQCPVVPGLARQNWSIPDPASQPPEFLSAIRDEIRSRVAWLVRERGWERAA